MLQSFRSSDKKGTAGIEFGTEWYSAIMSKLGEATDVVALLTTHSLDRPWLLYEAGVAKGKLNTTVLGVALGISLDQANNGPFAQFQNSSDDEDSLTKLVLQLIRRNPNAAPRDEAVRRQVEVFIAAKKTIIEKRGKAPRTAPKVDETSVAKMFEEVKILVRDLPERVSTVESSRARRRRSRFHPGMLFELIHMGLRMGRRRSPVGILLAFGVFQDSVPMLVPLGQQLYSAIVSANKRLIEQVLLDLRIAVDLIGRMPRELEFARGEDEEIIYVLRQFAEELEGVVRHTYLRPAGRRSVAAAEEKE
ncbi:MAG: hypothetical protein QOK24_1324 [Verrucomicrobiota bacterium]|jgi:hypothetical protein